MLALILVKIVIELIGDSRKLIEQIVHVLVEARPPRLRQQIGNLLLARIENLHIRHHALIRDVRRIAQSLNLFLAHGAVFVLGAYAKPPAQRREERRRRG